MVLVTNHSSPNRYRARGRSRVIITSMIITSIWIEKPEGKVTNMTLPGNDRRGNMAQTTTYYAKMDFGEQFKKGTDISGKFSGR